jgi:hypothetical protein
MERQRNKIEHLIVRTGLISVIALIAYFLVMRLIGLAEITELHYLNGVILLAAIIYALNKQTKNLSGSKMDYLDGIKIGMGITGISVVGFGVFVALYLGFADPAFLTYLQAELSMGDYFTPVTAGLAVFLEGVASGAVFTFVSMQYFKDVGSEKKVHAKHSEDSIYAYH